jgi:predicted Rossmann fold flavoprotein
MNQYEQFDVVVIGGGASGMMSAIIAAQNGKRVVLLEKNKSLGKKLDITGGGRCNITNAEFDTKKLLAVYGDAAPFLHSPFSQFSVQDTFGFFESRGMPLVVQGLKRAFPKTEKATDVTNLLKKELKKTWC